MIPNCTWGDDFSGLLQYLVDRRDHAVVDLCGVSSIDHAADEMQAVASASERARTPAMHVSFAAAIEDGVLTDATWISLADEAEKEFRLTGHQRVIVRHQDKGYDHIHCFWCTVNQDTGRTPPKQWFRTRGARQPELDQRALTDTMRACFPPEEVVRGSFSRFALARLQSVCRDFEASHKLRRLRDRRAAAAGRAAGQQRLRPDDRHREARTGRLPIIDHADTIRAALDEPDYSRARTALNRAGFDLEPAIRTLKDGTSEVRGLVIIDLVDPGNRVPASSLDLPDRRYGLRQIEKRHRPSAPTMEQWWPDRGCISTTLDPLRSEDQKARSAYQARRAEHRRAEMVKDEQRRLLARRQRKERHRRRAALMRLRALRASRLPLSDRRAFYRTFARTMRAMIWARLERRQANERSKLRRTSMPTWREFRLALASAKPAMRSGASVTSVSNTANPRSSSRPHRAERTPDLSLDAFVAQPGAQPGSDDTKYVPEDEIARTPWTKDRGFDRG